MSRLLNANTQRAAILRLLLDAKGAWIPLPEIIACAAQYNARIFELRKLYQIENRTQTDPKTGVRHSWFRLIAAEPAKAAVEVSEYMRRRREEEAAAIPLFAGASE